MKTEYEINSDTLAIVGMDKYMSKVIEKDNTFYVKISAIDIIDDSCKYFGSSYNGRFEGTKKLTGISYKSPIIIEESRNIIFFPTASPRITSCNWISLNNIVNYMKCNDKTKLIFSNGYNLELDISYNILENQILRATRLNAVLQNRKIDK